MARLVLLCLVVSALTLAQVAALAPNPACKDAASAKAEARTALRHYYRQKQASKWYCWPKKGADNKVHWVWKDNGNLISISTTALYSAAAGCYVMLTHSHPQPNIFFSGNRRADSDFQVFWKRPAGYAAANKNWHHGEIEAARFLASVDFADAAVGAYPTNERADILALRGKVAAGTLSVGAILPDRPFCEMCAGTAAAYGAGGAAVTAGSLLPIAKQAACTAHSALLGQMSAVTYATEQLTQAEKDAIDAAVKPAVANAACCTWEAAGRPDPVPAGCGGDESDDESDDEQEEAVVCGKRRRTCKGGAAPAAAAAAGPPAKKLKLVSRRLAGLSPK